MARDSWEIYFSRLFPASVSCLLLMSDSCRLISSCWVEGVCTSRAALGLACRYCLCLTKALNCWRWWGAVLLPQTTSECWGLTGQTAWCKIKVLAKKFRSGLMISPLSPPIICPRGPLLILLAIFSCAATRTSCLCQFPRRTCWSSTWPMRSWSCSQPRLHRSNTWSTTSSQN